MTLGNKNLISNYSSAKYSWLKSGGTIKHLYKVYKKNDLSNLFCRSEIKSKPLFKNMEDIPKIEKILTDIPDDQLINEFSYCFISYVKLN